MVWGLAFMLALPLAAMAGDDPNEKQETDKGGARFIIVRFMVGTEGMGVVQCGDCNTAGGCQSVWCQVGKVFTCKAMPAPGWKFTHWTANGNFAGDKPTKMFCRKGAELMAHFEKAK